MNLPLASLKFTFHLLAACAAVNIGRNGKDWDLHLLAACAAVNSESQAVSCSAVLLAACAAVNPARVSPHVG